jgi:hypothetical protein
VELLTVPVYVYRRQDGSTFEIERIAGYQADGETPARALADQRRTRW